jgi:Na+-transporting NADH:ubiquinone oxidoreductase subunit B
MITKMIRGFFDAIEPVFQRGGRLEHLNAVYEMFDTFFFTPSAVTRHAPHVRDAIDLKRLMVYVVLAVIPCALWGMYIVGYGANAAIASLGLQDVPGWRVALLEVIGLGVDPNSIIDCFLHGFLYFFPLYVVVMVVGLGIEITFAAIRNHEVNEGFLVTGMLFTLVLPPSTPLWQAALAIAFGVVFSKEVFGGTGKNFLNPALVARAFLYFSYPASQSGDAVWIPVDGYTAATALSYAKEGGVDALLSNGISWTSAFFGTIGGSFGETSTLLCILGAFILLYTRIASWRIISGVMVGMIATATMFNLLFYFGSVTTPIYAMPFYWHLVLGGFAFGTVFMATDPVSAASTNKGRWIYGGLIGLMVVLIRVVNPGYPEGMMLAILFGNVFAPVIDYFVAQANIRRRLLRNV